MMMLDSGTVSPRAASSRTGNFPIGHSRASAARSSAFERSTSRGVNGVPFSYSATSAFWQKEESGWKCRVRDMGGSRLNASWLPKRLAGPVQEARAVHRPPARADRRVGDLRLQRVFH